MVRGFPRADGGRKVPGGKYTQFDLRRGFFVVLPFAVLQRDTPPRAAGRKEMQKRSTPPADLSPGEHCHVS